MGKYTQKDAQKDTGSSRKETSEAHHTARDDCQKSNHHYDKSLSKGWGKRSDSKKK